MNSVPKALVADFSRSEQRIAELLDEIAAGRLELPSYELPAGLDPDRLQTGEQRTLLVRRKEDADDGPWQDVQEFARRCLVEEEVTVREVRAEGRWLAPVLVARDYAARLDAVRKLRHAAQDGDSGPEWLASRIALRVHPLARRVLPEEVLALSGILPKPSAISVVLEEHENPADPWLRQVRSDGFRTGADVSGTEVHLYARELEPTLVEDLIDGWCSVWRDIDRKHRQLFAPATELERHTFLARPEAASPVRSWSIHLGELLHPDGANAWRFGHSAPLRCAVLARSLAGALRGRTGCTVRSVLEDRLGLLERHVLPIARTRLREIAAGAARDRDRELAVRLLVFLGTAADFEGLSCRKLDLSRQILDEGEVEKLCALHDLEALDLSRAVVDRDLPGPLVGLPLQWLDLSWTPVTNSRLTALARMTSLRHLDLSFTHLNDLATSRLANFGFLEHLNLTGCRMSEEGAAAVRAALPGARVVS